MSHQSPAPPLRRIPSRVKPCRPIPRRRHRASRIPHRRAPPVPLASPPTPLPFPTSAPLPPAAASMPPRVRCCPPAPCLPTAAISCLHKLPMDFASPPRMATVASSCGRHSSSASPRAYGVHPPPTTHAGDTPPPPPPLNSAPVKIEPAALLRLLCTPAIFPIPICTLSSICTDCTPTTFPFPIFPLVTSPSDPHGGYLPLSDLSVPDLQADHLL
jgi:hypothetical protein